METIHIFVASSVIELADVRRAIGRFFIDLNRLYHPNGVRFQWNAPENMSKSLSECGPQSMYDQKIRDSDYFFLIIGEKLGPYSEHEYHVALKSYQLSSKPKIVPFFLKERMNPAEKKRLRKRFCEDFGAEQYVDTFDVGGITHAIYGELLHDENVKRAMALQEETVNHLATLHSSVTNQIQENQRMIEFLKSQELTPENLSRIYQLYEENETLVIEYNVNFPALFDYASFLAKENHSEKALDKCRKIDACLKLKRPEGTEMGLRAAVLGLMGKCFQNLYRIDAAEAAYRDALADYQELAETDTEYPDDYRQEYINIATQMAFMFSENNRPEESEALFRKARLMRENLDHPNSFDSQAALVRICDGEGLLFKDLGRVKEAEDCFRQAIRILEKLGLKNLEVWNGLGQVLTMTGRFAEAKELYQMILSEYNDDETPVPSVEILKYNFANLLAETQSLAEAEALYKSSLQAFRQMAESHHREFDPKIAMVANSFANLLYHENRLTEAEALYREAMEIRTRLADYNAMAYGPDLAVVCFNLAQTLSSFPHPDMDEVETLYRTALQQYRKLFALNDRGKQRTASACRALADFLIRNERAQEAEPLYQEALLLLGNLAKKAPEKYEIELGDLYDELFYYQYKISHEYKDARPMLEKARAIYAKYPQRENRKQQLLEMMDTMDKLEELKSLL